MEQEFKKIGLFGKYGESRIAGDVLRLATYLTEKKREVILEKSTAELLGQSDFQHAAIETIGDQIDLIIVIGGDGTLLNVARALADHEVPLLGINLGRLGFLTDISASSMTDELEKILDGDYETEERSMLHAEVMRAGKIVHTSRALNDVVVNKGELARLIEFETFIDGEFVNSVRADGVVVSTPTGSTAYALSAGGPILQPALPAIGLVPICPHTLSDRPIMVSDSCVIEIVMTELGNQRAYLTFDGQASISLQDRDHIFVRRMDIPIRLIHPSGRNHYSVLRAKLHWGEKI